MTPISTLLLTGENNHDWRRTAPFLRDLLQSSGRFAVTITDDPSQTLEGDLSGVGLFFSDYNGPLWSDAARQNFVAAVENGAGVCVLHAANNCFRGWDAWEKMCGLCFQKGSGHGQFHVFQIKAAQPEHPIVRGLLPFETTDELYHKMLNPRNADYKVLATAYSSAERGGTGRDEPVMLTTQFGRGRVFHTLLGHVWPDNPLVAIENSGFQETLLRGCQWAATGAVA